jgi:hypothetical protein
VGSIPPLTLFTRTNPCDLACTLSIGRRPTSTLAPDSPSGSGAACGGVYRGIKSAGEHSPESPTPLPQLGRALLAHRLEPSEETARFPGPTNHRTASDGTSRITATLHLRHTYQVTSPATGSGTVVGCRLGSRINSVSLKVARPWSGQGVSLAGAGRAVSLVRRFGWFAGLEDGS